MAGEDKARIENLEQEVFKALDHQTRRDVLRYVSEKKAVAFTDILNSLKVPDSPTLAYHLKTLAPFRKHCRAGLFQYPMVNG
jgi:predicted transcriptional regulator